MDGITERISKIWDKWASENDHWTIPITHKDYLNALRGEYHITVTCQKDIPREWYEPVKGKKLLGLASGGGQQMPIFVALGADVTVLDFSDKQLDSERMVADREK